MKQFIRNEDIVSAEMDGDLVMMSIDKGQYFGMGGTGPRIWDLLAKPISLPEIVAAISAEYEVEEARCASDVDGFLQRLLKDDLAKEV